MQLVCVKGEDAEDTGRGWGWNFFGGGLERWRDVLGFRVCRKTQSRKKIGEEEGQKKGGLQKGAREEASGGTKAGKCFIQHGCSSSTVSKLLSLTWYFTSANASSGWTKTNWAANGSITFGIHHQGSSSTENRVSGCGSGYLMAVAQSSRSHRNHRSSATLTSDCRSGSRAKVPDAAGGCTSLFASRLAVSFFIV